MGVPFQPWSKEAGWNQAWWSEGPIKGLDHRSWKVEERRREGQGKGARRLNERRRNKNGKRMKGKR